jgi:hypothetical protein
VNWDDRNAGGARNEHRDQEGEHGYGEYRLPLGLAIHTLPGNGAPVTAAAIAPMAVPANRWSEIDREAPRVDCMTITVVTGAQ